MTTVTYQDQEWTVLNDPQSKILILMRLGKPGTLDNMMKVKRQLLATQLDKLKTSKPMDERRHKRAHRTGGSS